MVAAPTLSSWKPKYQPAVQTPETASLNDSLGVEE